MNHDGNRPVVAERDDLTIVAHEHGEAVQGLWRGSLGRTVRCVPSRRALSATHRGVELYAKRYRTRRGADPEWRWLERLAQAGFAVPARVGRVRGRRGSMVVCAAVPGRSLDAWALTAAREGWLDRWFRFVVGEVAPLARRLHDRGWVHRDLNLPHLFAADPRRPGSLSLIDVERVFCPRWRLRRWVVKDLAALLASCPVAVPDRVAARFLLRYSAGKPRSQVRRLAREVRAKAARIRGRAPRYG
ncbi:MAG: lipopolysaccharide kinase InaA family protein [Planctomycetota bacterium]